MSKPFVPREYQRQLIEHALDVPRAALWAGMGTGKTSATLSAIDIANLAGDLTRPTLVLAPLRVARDGWPDEAAKWDHTASMGVVPMVGSKDERTAALRRVLRGNDAVATVNYESIPWLMEALGGHWPFGMVVADESTKLKSFRLRGGGERAKQLGKVAHLAPRWVNLTGTPSPNGLTDLWGQSWFLDKGQRLGRTYDAFKQRWFVKGYDGFSIDPLPYAQEQIEAALRDLCMTIHARDWFDIREPIVNVITVDMPPKARALYRDMEKKMWADIAGQEVEAVNAAAKTGKCLQLAGGAIYTDDQRAWTETHHAKIDALESIVEEAAGAPVLVAFNFRHEFERLRRAFPHSLDLSEREGLRKAKAGKGRVWLAHPASLGHGVDGLQDHCNQLVFFGADWNLENHDQIIERVGPTRQAQSGHDREVFVHYILAADTVDEIVYDRRANKRSVQDALLDAMKKRNLL